LQFFIGRGKTIVLEEKVATLLDDILQRDKAGLVFFQTLLQDADGFFDGWTVLAWRAFVRLGANKTIGENGEDQEKGLLAFCLSTKHSTNHFTFASPLAITVRGWACDGLAHLFPGRANAISGKLIEMRPKDRERLIDHSSAGI
jgi:hypothetical protein